MHLPVSQHASLLRRANVKPARRQLDFTSREGEVDLDTVSVCVCVCVMLLPESLVCPLLFIFFQAAHSALYQPAGQGDQQAPERPGLRLTIFSTVRAGQCLFQ